MAYITETFYEDTYYGLDAGTEFNRLAARASDDIDLAAGGPLVLADLDADQALLVQKATAAQVEYYVENGDTYNQPDGGGERLGSFSASTAKPKRGLCSRAQDFLDAAGLSSRAVSVLGHMGRAYYDE